MYLQGLNILPNEKNKNFRIFETGKLKFVEIKRRPINSQKRNSHKTDSSPELQQKLGKVLASNYTKHLNRGCGEKCRVF